MLRAARPIPRRYRRTVTPYTRALVRKFHRPRRRYGRERMRRSLQRWRERSAVLWRRFAASFWWVMGGVCLGVLLITLFSPLFSVRQISVSRRDPRIDVELVERALRPLFQKRLPFIRSQEVEPLLTAPLPDARRAAVPDLASVEMRKEYPSTIALTIVPQRLIANVRVVEPGGEAVAATGGTLQQFLTEKGLLVEYAPSQLSAAVDVPEIDIVDWGARPAPWVTVFDPEVLQEIRKAESLLLEQFGQGVTRRVLYMRAQEFHLLLDDNLTLWLDRRADVEEQLARYKLFLQVTPKSAARVYVDLRLRDRIIYK